MATVSRRWSRERPIVNRFAANVQTGATVPPSPAATDGGASPSAVYEADLPVPRKSDQRAMRMTLADLEQLALSNNPTLE